MPTVFYGLTYFDSGSRVRHSLPQSSLQRALSSYAPTPPQPLVLVLDLLLLLQIGNFGSQVDGLFDFVGEKVPGVVKELLEAAITTGSQRDA